MENDLIGNGGSIVVLIMRIAKILIIVVLMMKNVKNEVHYKDQNFENIL